MADKMQTVEELMLTGLTYVLDFENKASEGAKKMAQASTNPELKEAFEKTRDQEQGVCAEDRADLQAAGQAGKDRGEPHCARDDHRSRAHDFELGRGSGAGCGADRCSQPAAALPDRVLTDRSRPTRSCLASRVKPRG